QCPLVTRSGAPSSAVFDASSLQALYLHCHRAALQMLADKEWIQASIQARIAAMKRHLVPYLCSDHTTPELVQTVFERHVPSKNTTLSRLFGPTLDRYCDSCTPDAVRDHLQIYVPLRASFFGQQQQL